MNLFVISYSVRRELGVSVKSIVGNSSKLLSICTVRCSCEVKLLSVIRLFMVNVLLSRSMSRLGPGWCPAISNSIRNRIDVQSKCIFNS